MKLFTKKTLAILLSALIVMGSVSIAAFADPTGTFSTKTTFYNGTETGEKVYAKPGDEVKAVVSLTSDFNAGSMAFEYQYDAKMFEPDFTKSSAVDYGYALIPAAGNTDIGGYYKQGNATAPSGTDFSETGTLYVSIDTFKVQQYSDTPAFEVYFKVKSDVPVDEEGEMTVMPGTTMNGDDDTLPTEVDYITDDSLVGTTQPVPASSYLPASDYGLTVNSESNKVVVKGSVTYDPNEGNFSGSTAPVVSYGYYGAPITDNTDKPADPTKDGSTFKGWGEDPASTTPLTEAELAAIVNDKDGEKTLYAIYELDDVSITFNTDGGSAIDPITAKPGDSITAPENPTKEGYDFAGWKDENGNDVDFPSVMPDEDLALTAKWTPKEYTVHYDANGGTPDPADATVAYDNALPDDPTVNRDGYTFNKWVWTYGDVTDGDKPEKMPAGDVNAKALWTREVSITLDKEGDDDPVIKANDNSNVYTDSEGNPVTTDPDKPTSLPGIDPANKIDEENNPIADFEGWKIVAPGTPNDGKLYDFTKSPRENLGVPEGEEIPDFKLEPSFIPYYTVTFLNEDGSEAQKDYVLEGASMPDLPADPEIPEGKVFKGWLNKADGNKKPSDYTTMPAQDLVFTATFVDQEAGTYKAIFKDGDKTITEEAVKAGDPIPVPSDPKKFGMVFKGWEPAVPDAMPEQNMTFQAQWEVDKTFVAVIVGGTAIAGGVATAIAAGNTALIVGGAVVGGIAVAAVASKTHKVTYLVDGSVYRVFYIIEGTKIIVPKDPTKDGYTFKGWNPEVPERMPNHDLTFEAEFARNGADIIDDIPDTGSATAGLAVFAVISGACAAAYVMGKKKKEF